MMGGKMCPKSIAISDFKVQQGTSMYFFFEEQPPSHRAVTVQVVCCQTKSK